MYARNEAEKQVDSAPMRRRKRVDGRCKQARRVKELVANYTARLGNNADLDRIRRAAELVALGETLRARAMRGEVDLTVLVKVENLGARAMRSLGLDRGRPQQVTPQPTLPELEAWTRARVAAGT
jgi:hypothetical protein